MAKTAFELVREFHAAFKIKDGVVPALPDAATRELRKNILDEEHEEYHDAEAADDLVEIADALLDMIYIAYGTGASYGLPMDELFREVHRSNMSKLDENGQPVYRADGKVIKSALFSRPDLKSIIERHQNKG